MMNSSDDRQGLTTWRTCLLSLAISLGAGCGGLCAQERLAADLDVSHGRGISPAGIQIFEHHRGGLPDGSKHAQELIEACDAAHAKVRYLIEELITQRTENARLSIEMAEEKAEDAEIEEITRQQEELLAALMAVVATRQRQDATVRLENADLQQQLEATRAELRRKSAQNDRLAAKLAAAHKAAEAATVMAQGNLAVIDAQIEALQAADGKATQTRAEQGAELLSAIWVDGVPATAHQESQLESRR
jgi:DNA repair exonuclease SbcCD ATPase subunit